MPQTGMALETVSPLFGRTLNPFNTEFSAGGSSGGDAVLVALHGAPFAPSTDIGGSIRAPAAFNGLYGIRPTADRVPKRGMKSVESGQLNMRVSCGPVCHSMSDLKLLTSILINWPSARYDTTCIPVGWRDVQKPSGKLAFGYMEFDGAVMPQPPILRAMREAAEKLKSQGHEGNFSWKESPLSLMEANQPNEQLSSSRFHSTAGRRHKFMYVLMITSHHVANHSEV